MSEPVCPNCGQTTNPPIIEAGGYSRCNDKFHGQEHTEVHEPPTITVSSGAPPGVVMIGEGAVVDAPAPLKTALEWFNANCNQFLAIGEYVVTGDGSLQVLDEQCESIPIPAWSIVKMLEAYAAYRAGRAEGQQP